jgi:hypothetical protein
MDDDRHVRAATERVSGAHEANACPALLDERGGQ